MNVAEAINIFTTLIKVGLLTLCGLFALVKTTNKADAGLTPKADTVRHLLISFLPPYFQWHFLPQLMQPHAHGGQPSHLLLSEHRPIQVRT